ncbi:hypothetical protein OSB04_005412 [Centaurea solstitialis]|uniref:Protein kinase domain-containing protein n=1 Tax=Centaurea solstitialis TaxID=347529 RepID=A0AA38WGR6_9ASTR|nr:hypothetical protein OSB04_005412 [Centaurea solstitialis]
MPPFFFHLLLLLSTIFTLSSSSSIAKNLTLIGSAIINNNSIILTQQQLATCNSNSVNSGRVLHSYPIRFLRPSSSNATAVSFSTRFSATILPSPPPCPPGEGIAFLILSNPNSLPRSHGYLGLPDSPNPDPFFAIEFDTAFDPDLGDINDNHIGVDVDSIISVASIDLMSKGIDLKNGRRITAWIEYRDSEKIVRVWVHYSETKPETSILAVPIDLSKILKEFMYVGFSASNGRGSSIHSIDKLQFNTFDSVSPDSQSEAVSSRNCLVCYPEDLEESELGVSGKKRHRRDVRLIELAFGLGGGVVVLMILAISVLVYCICVTKRRQIERGCSQNGPRMYSFQGGTRMPKKLKLNEIKSATKGASSIVYEANLPSCGNVAVKRFCKVNQSSTFGNQFATELETMVGCLRHKNLVKLQGWCCERNELVLVYEHMANGSLDRILHRKMNGNQGRIRISFGTYVKKFSGPTLKKLMVHSNIYVTYKGVRIWSRCFAFMGGLNLIRESRGFCRSLTFEKRVNILLGVSAALIYLHEECERQIIHRDVKTCNIMLDAEFNAKLGDFGLAEVYEHSSTRRDATLPAGTMGYLAPEYVYSGVPTVKTDVYSFGVVVLEVASGQRPVNEEGVMVTDWVWDLWEKRVLIAAADPNLMGRFDEVEMERVLMAGLICVHPNHQRRPTMKEAVLMLKGRVVPDLPPRKPAVMIQSVRSSEMMMGRVCGLESSETPWSTPRTHFSRQ